MRRGVGIRAIKNSSLTQAQFKAKAAKLADAELANLTRQVDQIKQSLELFAAKHGSKIRSDPSFRGQFQAMCSSIGVDPLVYSRGCWLEALGLGEFYYHLAVRIIEVCMARQHETGGLMALNDLVSQLNKTRSRHQAEISKDDVSRSIKRLRVLGTGFALINLPSGNLLVQSVPGEISLDQSKVFGLAEQSQSRIGLRDCVERLGWSQDRAQTVLDRLVQQSVVWVDDDTSLVRERLYWFPSLFQAAQQ